MMQKAWRQDLNVRAALSRSDSLAWALVALVVPFGWVFLLWRLEPVRSRIRSLRSC
jgi:hypothetical protein